MESGPGDGSSPTSSGRPRASVEDSNTRRAWREMAACHAAACAALERDLGERHGLGARQVRDRRNGADIETAKIIFAAEVGSFKGRRNDPAVAADK